MACRKKAKDPKELDEIQKRILKALAEFTEPAGCKEIAEKAGLPTPKVTGKLRGLKNRGFVESPVKGKYVITAEGKSLI